MTHRYTLSIERPGGKSTLSHFSTLAAVSHAAGVTSATARKWIRDNNGYQPGNDLRRVRITKNETEQSKSNPAKKRKAKKETCKEKGGIEFCVLGWLIAVLAVLTHFI